MLWHLHVLDVRLGVHRLLATLQEITSQCVARFIPAIRSCLMSCAVGMQMELKVSLAVLVGRLHLSADTNKMSATTPAELMAGTRDYLTIEQADGIHLRVAPRV